MSEYSHNPLKPLTAQITEITSTASLLARTAPIAALLESPSIAAAARKAEVGESTLRQWLREDEDFQAMLRLTRHETLSHVTTRLQQEAEKAVDAASTMIASKRKIEPGRASLIRTLFDFAYRSNAHSDIAGVVRSLETVIKAQAENQNDQNQRNQNQNSRNQISQDHNSQDHNSQDHRNRNQNSQGHDCQDQNNQDQNNQEQNNQEQNSLNQSSRNQNSQDDRNGNHTGQNDQRRLALESGQ